MSLADLLLILTFPAAILLAGFCAASETAVFSLTHSDRARLRRQSPDAEAAISKLLARPRTFLLSVLFLTNLANVVYFVVGSMYERRYRGHGVGLAINIGLLIALILCADLLPKLMARARRIGFCRIYAPVLTALVRLVGPICDIFEWLLVEPVLRLIQPARAPGERALSTEELAALLDLRRRAGEIAEDEQRLLADVVDLGATRIREVMTPRVSMRWVADDAPAARVREIIRATPQTRLPLFRGSLDGGPVGMLDVKRYLAALEGPGGGGVRPIAFLLPPVFVPESARLDQLLELLRREGDEQALAVDEFGAVVGIVTIEDVIGRLLAVSTEEPGSEGGGVTRIGPDRWAVPGRLPARELAEYFFGPGGGKAVDARVSTVAGLVYARLGRVPRTGDSVRLGNVTLTVEAMRGRAIDRVGVSVAGGPR